MMDDVMSLLDILLSLVVLIILLTETHLYIGVCFCFELYLIDIVIVNELVKLC